MASFPEGWFFIKNYSNGYVLSTESTERFTIGESVIISSIRSKDFDSQLWRYGDDGRLYNKKTNWVLDVAKGEPKVGTDIVQQSSNNYSENQIFKTSSEGYIYLSQDSNLVLGTKDSFFSRKEGQHVHLQFADENSNDRKEQRWEFVLSSIQHTPSISSISSLKRTMSVNSLGSLSSAASHNESCTLDEECSAPLDSFPDTPFFIKSEMNGFFISVEAASANTPGSRLILEPLRKNNYESQLWHYDAVTSRLFNKSSGFYLSAEELADESRICQSSDNSDKEFKFQAWSYTPNGEIRLKYDHHWVLGFKKDGWFGLNREGTGVLLQGRNSDGRVPSHHKFIIVLPIFKKVTSEIVTVCEQMGAFPEGFFFIKNHKNGLVLTILDTGRLAAEAVAAKLDTENYNRQLWRHNDGFLFNKASKLVLDIRGGCITNGAEICHYKQKKEDYENQQWSLSIEGYIQPKTRNDIVLSIDGSKADRSNVFLEKKRTPDYQEQRWNFVLPVFKQKTASVAETTVKKSVTYHRYAQYPTGWFFIRCSVSNSTADAPFVLTANSTSHVVTLQKVSKESWCNQLWMYLNGALINFQTQRALDVEVIDIGSSICQESRQANSVSQRWNLTIDGYIIHGSNPSLSLVPKKTSEGYSLTLADHVTVQKEIRWGLLTPEIKVENNIQVLVKWTVTVLSEWKQTKEQAVQKVVHRIADWPEQQFYIGANNGMALVPEKSEAFSSLVIRKLEYGQSESFQWVYRNGYIVHCATGLVLHASDDLVSGSHLQIREELISESKHIDQRQQWLVKTDGSIVSQRKNDLGFALLKQGDQLFVQLAYVSNTSEHYSWTFMYGHYETRYSNVYKKEVKVLTRTENILLSVQTSKANTGTKVVTQSVGVFPENWFFIRSQADQSLVLTAPDDKEGSKLTLSKIDFKNFRLQLWRYQDDGCLANLSSSYVVDVAGGAFNHGSDIIQWREKYLKKNRNNQIWGLSVDGHIHPKLRPGLVLGVKDGKVFDGAEIQLLTRGALELGYQRFTFASPIFGRHGDKSVEISTSALLEKNDSQIFISNVDETHVKTTTTDKYESENKVSIIRRWGIFPQDSFFIRAAHGGEHFALTVEKNPRKGEKGSTEYEVTLRPINFKEYKWHLWTYSEGHLINSQTGLALDSSFTQGLLLEEGLHRPLFVREKSMSESQFWSLTVNGEVFLRSDERLVIGVSNSQRVSVSGAQVGLVQLKIHKFINAEGQQETSLKSESYLKWVFSKPVFKKITASSSTTTTTTTISESEQVVESFTDESISVKKQEVSAEDYIESVDDDVSEDEESNSSEKSSSTGLGKFALVTAGAAGVAAVGSSVLSFFNSSKPVETTVSNIYVDDKKTNTQTAITKNTTYRTLETDRKESFHISIDYEPTGFEKIVRYNTYKGSNFPTTGYFMIRSYIHGYVLDVADSKSKEGSTVVVAPIKTKDFASQLWAFKNGYLINLKNKDLVLDGSISGNIVAGEKLTLSKRTELIPGRVSDQLFEYSVEGGGMIYLQGKRDLVVSVKETNRKNASSLDVYIMDERASLKDNFARPEQRWEIKVPAMLSVEQSTTVSETGYTIIEGGKITTISSSVAAIVAFKWLKETYRYKLYEDNQWPSIQNWFFIRFGNESGFLASGETDFDEVKIVNLTENEDHKRFLWIFVNGYLVNYKYMLRVTFDKKANGLILSSSKDTLEQKFCISKDGHLSVKNGSEITYLNVKKSGYQYQIIFNQAKKTYDSKCDVQLHVPVYLDSEVENSAKVAISATISWVQSSQTISTSSTTSSSVIQRYGIFPEATWFFVKAQSRGSDSLVLAVKNSSSETGVSLVLKKLSFKDYKSQLWTFRDGALINYGSKFVIDVQGDIKTNSKLIQSSEASVGSQKWSLTTEGQIYLSNYSHLALGYEEIMREDIEVSLVSLQESKDKIIQWRFSVPVFGKATVKKAAETSISTTTTVVTSSIERISECIEQGAIIESIEEADIKIDDAFVKKNTFTSVNATTKDIKQDGRHDFHEILKDVGIAATTGLIGAAVIGTASKIADKFSQQDTSKKSKDTIIQEHASTSVSRGTVVSSSAVTSSNSVSSNIVESSSSSVTDKNKTRETVVIHKSQKTSLEIIEESQTIIHAWKIVFSQRVRKCQNKNELIQVINESREELFRRLDEHLRVHASVDHLISGSVPEWHSSIYQVKEIYRARVFEKFLDQLKLKKYSKVSDINFQSTLDSVTEEVDSHYQLIIEQQKKTGVSTSTEKVYSTDSSVHETVLVAVDDIKVSVRYWLIDLYEALSIAHSNNASEAEIQSIVEASRKQLSSHFEEIKTSVTGTVENSSSKALVSKNLTIKHSIEAAIKATETTVSTHVTRLVTEKKYLSTQEQWSDVTRITEETLSSELQVYQTAITQEVSEVQKSELKESSKTELTVVLDEKMTTVAQQTISSKLIETKTRLSSWFVEVTQQILYRLEDAKEFSSDEIIRKDTLAIINASQIEVSTIIEETKLVLRAYYAHLTYLSWAERRRIEYALDNVKATMIANILQFKKRVEKTSATKEEIIRYCNYSFGSNSSRIVLNEIQSIVNKVTRVSETVAVTKTEEKKSTVGNVSKVTEKETQTEEKKSTVGVVSKVTEQATITEEKKSTTGFVSNITEGATKTEIKSTISNVSKDTDVKQQTQVVGTISETTTKADEVRHTTSDISTVEKTKVTETLESEVEKTESSKVEKKENIQKQKDSSSGISSTVLGAAATAIASAAIFHHYEGKENKQQGTSSSEKVSEKIIEKPAISHTNVIVGNTSETIHIDEKKSTSTISKKEKVEILTSTYTDVQVSISKWFSDLSDRVFQCAKQKNSNVEQEIETIISKAQEELVVSIEKAKRTTTSVMGTSQTSFHETLSSLRTHVWSQTFELKHIGVQFASSTESNFTEFEQTVQNLKKTTLTKVVSEIEKCKSSASVIHIVDQKSSSITAGNKFQGVDYSKSSYGQTIEKTKSSVGFVIEDTRINIQNIFNHMTTSIAERRKQGGDNVDADVILIIKKSRSDIDAFIKTTKSSFEEKIKASKQTSTKQEYSTLELEILEETNKKLQVSLDQIYESVTLQVSKVEELTVTSSISIHSESEVTERLEQISHETREKVNTTLNVSETIIGHHVEVIADSNIQQAQTVSETTSKKSETSRTELSLGVEYGLIVVSEVTKSVSSRISELVERITHRTSADYTILEKDIEGYTITSEKELDRICEEAKAKITYELSMVASHEKVGEKFLLSAIESIRSSSKARISQIKKISCQKEENTTAITQKLLQVAEESRYEVLSHYESVKQNVTTKTEKVNKVVQGESSHTSAITQGVSHKSEQKEEKHESATDVAKKVLIGSAFVAAGTAIAVEVAKKISEHKEKTEKTEQRKQETVTVVEDVKVQFNKWISSLTETVVQKTKQSNVSKEEIAVTVEKSKTEFVELIKKTKSSTSITESHQIEILSWIETTAIAQANRIQEVAISTSTTSVTDIESRLDVIKVATTQEVNLALEYVKKSKDSAAKFVGISVDQIKQKESSLLDVKSELILVIQDVKTSLLSFYKEFSSATIQRVKAGGENVDKDVAVLVAEARKRLTVHIEQVKETASKRLSAMETKSAYATHSVAALSGIANAEIIHLLKSSEDLISQKIKRVYSSVWYIETDQDTSKIVEKIVAIEEETTTQITEKVESSKHTFISSTTEHHESGYISTQVSEEKESSSVVLKAALSVQEVKITVREWLRTLAEKLSTCAEHGGSSQEIDTVISKETSLIFEYLDNSNSKISEVVKSEENISQLHSTIEAVKGYITKTSSEIKVIAVESSKQSNTYGGFDKMTSVITRHEHQISEILVTYESKCTSQKKQEVIATSEEKTTLASKEESKDVVSKAESSTVASKEESRTVVSKEESSAVVSREESKTVTSGATTVNTVEYIQKTITIWLERLTVSVSECAKRERKNEIATKEINSIVSEEKDFITAEINMISEKLRASRSKSSQEIISILEWTRGMVIQSSSQIQSIGINAAVSHSSTGGYDQMKSLVSATLTQIVTAVARCDKSVKIQVETSTSHAEKLKARKEYKELERKKSESEKPIRKSSKVYSSGSEEDSYYDSEKKSKKTEECEKDKEKTLYKKPKKFDSCSESESDEEHDSSKKKFAIGSALGIVGGITAGVISKLKNKKKDSESDVSDSESDSESEKKNTSQVAVGKVDIRTTYDVTVIVSQWYEYLITEVSKRAKKGGSSASTDIEIIIQKATKNITETLAAVSTNAHLHLAEISSVQQYRSSIEWTKNLVIESAYQIKTIALQSALSVTSRTGGIERMRPIAIATQEQVSSEIRRYRLVSQTTLSTSTSTSTSISTSTSTSTSTKEYEKISKVEHQINSEKVNSSKSSAVSRQGYIVDLKKSVTVILSETKTNLVQVFTDLITEISIVINQNDSHVERETSKVIEKYQNVYRQTIKQATSKLISLSGEYEKDRTFDKLISNSKNCFKEAQVILETKIQEIQNINKKSKSEYDLKRSLSVVLESFKTEISQTLNIARQKSIDVIQIEETNTESTVVIINTVEEVKTKVSSWHQKLNEEIHIIVVDTTIINKEERIRALIQEATTEIDRVISEAKSTVSTNCSSVRKIDKFKEQELLASLDFVKNTFSTDVKKIEQVSIEAVTKSSTDIKEKVSTVIESSGEKIQHAITGTTAVVVGHATTDIAIHDSQKSEKKYEETAATGKWSIDAQENSRIISKWFELYTKSIINTVNKKGSRVMKDIEIISQNAQKEITEMISTARTDFKKRLSNESIDQEAYEYACKHYEESLNTVRTTILKEIYEAKSIAIKAHTTGRLERLELELTELTMSSSERINTVMGSSVVITQQAHISQDNTTAGSSSVLQIDIKDEDAFVIDEQDIDFERKEKTQVITHEEKTKKTEKAEEKQSNIGKIIASSIALGAGIAGSAFAYKKYEEKEESKHKEDVHTTSTSSSIESPVIVFKYDNVTTAVESNKFAFSQWYSSLTQSVSEASIRGASSQEIVEIVETHRKKIITLSETSKKGAEAYFVSTTDKEQYFSKIDWAVSFCQNQALQIQQIGINAASSKTNISSQLKTFSTASYHQIEFTLEELKSNIKFQKKMTEAVATEIKTKEKIVQESKCENLVTSIEKTKTAYSVIQETRATTITMFVALSEKIVTRIRQGGSHVKEDVIRLIESTETEVSEVFDKATNIKEFDEKSRIEVEKALYGIHSTINEQITEVKTVSINVVSNSRTDSKEACEKVLDVCKDSKEKIDYEFVSVSTAITAGFTSVVKSAEQTSYTVQNWYSSLKTKINKVLETSDLSQEETKTKVTTIISEAEVELNTKITKLQEQTVGIEKTSTTEELSSTHHLDIFYTNIKSSALSQLSVIKQAVQESSFSKETISTALSSTQSKLALDVKNHYHAVEKINSVERFTETEKQTNTKDVKKKSIFDAYKDRVEKIALGSAAVATAAAVAIGFHKNNQQTQATTVQTVNKTSVQETQTIVEKWFSSLKEQVIVCTKRGGSSTEVAKIVEKAQSELEVTLEQINKQYSSTTSASSSTSSESHRTFTSTLEWIKTTAISQSNQITQIVSQSSSSAIDVSTQIENHVFATNQQIGHALEVHCGTSTVNEETKQQQQQQTTKFEDKSREIIEVGYRNTETVIEVSKETREQTRERVRLEMTLVVQETKTEITKFLASLSENITTIIYESSGSVRKDILSRLEKAEKDLEVLVQNTKQKFTDSTSKTSATTHIEAESQTLVLNSVKQTLDCIESIKATLTLQISVIREVITRIEVEDIDVIIQRLESIITRTKQRVYHTLDHSVDISISSAFEGKVVVWSETPQVPDTFKSVRAFAFDIVGTVVNYRKTLYEVWKKIITPKNDVVLSGLNFDQFIHDWYGAFVEIREKNFVQKRSISDDAALHEALVHILNVLYIKKYLTESEIKELCEAWRSLDVYEDANIGIRRIKNQISKKYTTVAISDTFSTRSMIDLAQHGCLCWNAQFSYDMFSSQARNTSASEAVVDGAIELLGLDNANQLAIVSSNPQLLSAAKKKGCHVVMIQREEEIKGVRQEVDTKRVNEVDIKVDGLDILGETIQSYMEHETMVKNWDGKDAPEITPVLVQLLKGPALHH